MHGLLYINDERIGEANLQLAFGRERSFKLSIKSSARTREYTINEGDVYVNGSRLGVRGFVAAQNGCRADRIGRRPVMTTFELIPLKQSLATAAKGFLARFLYGSRRDLLSVERTGPQSGSRSLRTETATQ